MPNNAPNSDYKVLCNKIDNLTTQVGKNEVKLDTYHRESQTRIVLAEKQLALMEQSYEVICKEVGNNKDGIKTLSARQDKNDMWTKIVGGVETALVAALAYVGINK